MGRVVTESYNLNPLDFIEEVVVDNSWPHNRINEDTLYVEISGQWCDYFFSIAWSRDSKALQYTCTYNIRVRPGYEESLSSLINLINCQLCFGHFEFWKEDNWIIYRNSVFAYYNKNISSDQISQIFSSSIGECEKYYPAFQFLLWEKKSPKDAIAASMLNTLGEA